MAGNPIIQTITQTTLGGASGTTVPFSFDFRDTPFNYTVQVTLVGDTTVTGYTLQTTASDLNAVPPSPTYTLSSANWINNAEMTSVSASSTVGLETPSLFGRLSVTTLSNGGSLLLEVVPGTTMGI